VSEEVARRVAEERERARVAAAPPSSGGREEKTRSSSLYERLARSIAPEICGHEDVKKGLAAATHPHSPATQNCLGCHDPHASKAAPSLLVKAPPALCVGCHNPAQPGFAKAHLNYPVAGANCLSCHDPHGSPNKGILWASVHAPVQNKMCAQCHGEPPKSEPKPNSTAHGASPLSTQVLPRPALT